MKLAILTDTHYGVKSDSTFFLDYQKSFMDNVFFPFLDKEGIKTIVHLGDLVDRRKFININTLRCMRTDFLERIGQTGRIMHIIPGNHDVYAKNTNEVNALDELLDDSQGIMAYHEPAELVFGETKISLIPWISPENEARSVDFIQNTDSKIVFGHFQLVGFEMYKGAYCESGHDPKMFDRFDLVASGHFHHRSTYHNINYLGSPYEMTWADYADTKGFHTFDTESQKLEFIENPMKLYRKIKYRDAGKKFEDVMDLDFGRYQGCFVKVIVISKENPFLFDTFIQNLENAGVQDLKTVDDHLKMDLGISEANFENVNSTMSVLETTIKESGIPTEMETRLIHLMNDLYQTAMMSE